MTIVSEGAKIVNVRFDQLGLAGAADDAVIERTGEELGEDGDDVKTHW